MGWASGSALLARIWARMRDRIPEDKRVDELAELMFVFGGEDCDTLDEVIDDDWPESKLAYEQFMSGPEESEVSEFDKNRPDFEGMEKKELIKMLDNFRECLGGCEDARDFCLMVGDILKVTV
jgi:hypothetical protein